MSSQTYNLRERPSKVVKPPRLPRKKRVYRLKNGTISLLHTPPNLLKATQHNANLPLLKLPPELRNKIYGYVLDNVEVEIGSWRKSRIIDQASGKHIPARHSPLLLPSICRQVHNETAGLVYERCVFSFSSKPTLIAWYDDKIGKSFQLNAIRTIKTGHYFFGNGFEYEAGMFSELFPNLTTLIIAKCRILRKATRKIAKRAMRKERTGFAFSLRPQKRGLAN
ncbi:hypothetical protein CC78DRAFT_567145 [Lojkania enalia]|uniref:Uncharacterized protein n=1 Tax=Lojkania enalia TaxID=147567 RepID=A0A9P4KE75_9PLEO|nr:hypothetical protein CC78DRAFT_567145 [Didymosphaeria enalia]